MNPSILSKGGNNPQRNHVPGFGLCLRAGLAIACLLTAFRAPADQIFETTSAYHHIRVTEENGLRTLYFDDATETRMSVDDPLTGHFEYTEYFHMPWLWNTNLRSVLMIGLGGGSAQKSFEHHYPGVTIDTVEIDAVVVQVARAYFNYKPSERQKIHVEDGRMYLRRNPARYDAILLDAYVQGRYGSSIPQHLATREFFELVRDRLTTNGVVAYNVIGRLNAWNADIVGAIYRTLKAVFPQVYLFPAQTSQNVVFIATRAPVKANLASLRQRAAWLVQSKLVTLPGFAARVERLQAQPPSNAARSPVLTDDYAPVEGLAGGGGKGANAK